LEHVKSLSLCQNNSKKNNQNNVKGYYAKKKLTKVCLYDNVNYKIYRKEKKIDKYNSFIEHVIFCL